MTPAELSSVKDGLIATWSRRSRPETERRRGGIEFQGLRDPGRPRSGLAVGHSLDPKTGKPRLEMRVSSASGPNMAHARKLADEVRAQGLDAFLSFMHFPTIAAGDAPAPLADATAYRRPLFIGQSVAHELGSAGSLGAFVKLPDESVGMLSCTHVLAQGGGKLAKKGDLIHQPGRRDQTVFLPRYVVGALSDFAPFVASQQNNLDAAVAKIDDHNWAAQGNCLPDLPCVDDAAFRAKPFGAMINPAEVELGARVVKFGRSTGLTRGARVGGVAFQNLQVAYRTPRGEVKYIFSSVIEILWEDKGPPFTLPGDSGSMVLLEDGLRPLGLHFAALETGRRSFVIPIKRICDIFEVQLAQ